MKGILLSNGRKEKHKPTLSRFSDCQEEVGDSWLSPETGWPAVLQAISYYSSISQVNLTDFHTHSHIKVTPRPAVIKRLGDSKYQMQSL